MKLTVVWHKGRRWPAPRVLCGLLALLVSGASTPSSAAEPWSVSSFPDEAGFQSRIAGLVERMAGMSYQQRSMAPSVCPDTGLPVFTWAVAGEEIISPYTGRRYRQGETGYFGPKERDADGRISRFGGDPLKVALPPATAVLLWAKTHPGDSHAAAEADRARAYLSIPGNVRQQYHFAAVNWVRLLGLVGDQMSAEWHEQFQQHISAYEEKPTLRGPVVREYQPVPGSETLVGLPDEHLGGGGTENHKTMWRTSGLFYAQTFPARGRISGLTADTAEKQTAAVLSRYARALFSIGNGEYDSSTYYPYTLRSFLNLYDFSPKPATQALAQAVLDYAVATYGLKVFNGEHAGPQRRGWVDGRHWSEMDAMLAAWSGGQPGYTTLPLTGTGALLPLHQITSRYRPNRVLTKLMAKNVRLPFEAKLNHPDYAMKTPGAQPEYFYCSSNFALGSVQLDAVNNSAQQTTWSLNVRDSAGSLIFSGGQPRWLGPEGHSPYDQWVQHRGALLLMSAPSAAPAPRYEAGALLGHLSYTRDSAFAGSLDAATPMSITADRAVRTAWFEAARAQGATWLYFPQNAKVTASGGRWVVETPGAFVVVTPFGGDPFWIRTSTETAEDLPGVPSTMKGYDALVMPMRPVAGFAIEAVERSAFPQLSSLPKTTVKVEGLQAEYAALNGSTLSLDYQPHALRPIGKIDGAVIDWTNWANGAVVESPYLRIADGRMWASDGTEAYEMDYRGLNPVWRTVAATR